MVPVNEPCGGIAKTVIGEKEKGLVAAVVKLRDENRTAHCAAELVSPEGRLDRPALSPLNPSASMSLLRRYSNADPWTWLVPDFRA